MKPEDLSRHPPGIEPHDPRLSEWIDGRLTPAEAAEVERLVAASPELTQIVADLRAMKEALGSMPAATAPAGFVRDVLAAVEAADRGSPDRGDLDDAEVEAEWRKLERQRIDEEIAEAHEDTADTGAETMRHRWPWLALAASLAAGVLVAFLINRPGPGDRQLAMTEAARQAAPAPSGADQPPLAAAPADAWTPEQAETAAPPPAEESRVVTVRIRDAEGRPRLGRLLATSGLETKAAAGEGERELLAEGRGRAAQSAEPEAEKGRDAADAAKPAAPAPVAEQDEAQAARAPERIEVSGPAEAIAALAAALEALASEPRADADAAESLARSPAAVPGAAAEAGGSSLGAGAADRAAVEPAATRLVILVVDEFGADPADQQEEP